MGIDPLGMVVCGRTGHRSAPGCAEPRDRRPNELARSRGRELALALHRRPVVRASPRTTSGTDSDFQAAGYFCKSARRQDDGGRSMTLNTNLDWCRTACRTLEIDPDGISRF